MSVKQHTEETKEKIRQAHLGLYVGEKNPMYGKKHSPEAKEKISQKNSKPVSMYSLSGRFIQTFPSVSVAAEAMGVTCCSISACANKASKTCCGMLWRFYESEHIPADDMPGKFGLCKSISQYDLHGNFIRTYESLKAASSATGLSISAIMNAAKGRTKHSGGFKWKYQR